MKARVKASGEVFEIASYATIPMECCDSFGNPLSFSFDEVEVLSEGNDLKEGEAPRLLDSPRAHLCRYDDAGDTSQIWSWASSR